MNYVYAASVADIQPGKMKAIVVEGKEILLINEACGNPPS